MPDTKWVVPKESIEEALSLVETVPTRNGIKSSEYIKVSKAKGGAAFHLCSDLSAKVVIVAGESYPFEDLFLDRRLFSPFVTSGKDLKATDYIFTLRDKQLIVQHGHRRALYTLSDLVEGYEPLGKALEDAKTTGINKKLISILDCAENCATPDPMLPNLNCVYVTQKDTTVKAYATDQHVVFMGKFSSDKTLAGDIAFPLGLIPVIKEQGAAKIYWTNKLACIDFPKGKVWSAVKTQTRKNFPLQAVAASIKESLSSPVVANINSGTFTRAADRIAKYVSPLMSDELGLEIHLTKGSRKIKLIAGDDISKFHETITAINESKKDLVLDWPLQLVLPVILFAKDEGSIRVHYNAANKASCISSKSLTLAIAGSA